MAFNLNINIAQPEQQFGGLGAYTGGFDQGFAAGVGYANGFEAGLAAGRLESGALGSPAALGLGANQQQTAQFQQIMAQMMQMLAQLLGGKSAHHGHHGHHKHHHGNHVHHGGGGHHSVGGGDGASGGGGGDISPTNSTHDASGTSPNSSAGPIHNETDFAKALLDKLGYPATSANINSLVTWQKREGGNWNNSAHYNPLNTTTSETGATSMNSVGVKSYGSWDQGIEATIKTLENGRYGDILSALQSGQGLSHGSFKGLSTWSGGGYSSI